MNSKNLLIERVYSLKLTQRATLVAFYLINRANSEGTCFPGIKTIAKECNISTRTVQRALNDLEETGFIVRESRFHVQGGQRSNLYYLQTLREEQQVEAQPDMDYKGEETSEGDGVYPEDDFMKINVSHIDSFSVDLPSINFKEILKECVSRSPCHDGIP